MIGFLNGVSAQIPLFPFVVKQLTLGGISVGSRATFEKMLTAFERWQLHPIVDAVSTSSSSSSRSRTTPPPRACKGPYSANPVWHTPFSKLTCNYEGKPLGKSVEISDQLPYFLRTRLYDGAAIDHCHVLLLADDW